MRPFLLAACLLAGAATPAARALADEGGLAGVWRGTLGTQAIVACFDDAHEGRYYYESRGRNLWLEAKDDAGPFAEKPTTWGSPTGYWRVGIASGELQGSWSRTEAGKPLPIRAHRVALSDSAAPPCDSEEFDAPRMDPGQWTAREAVQSGLGVRLDKARGSDVERLQIRGADASIAAINAVLDADFRESLAISRDCEEFAVTPLIEHADERWIVVRFDGGGYCGGAHPDTWANFMSFERHGGREVDTSDWIANPGEPRTAFWQLLYSKLKRPDCEEEWLGGVTYLKVRPSPAGVRIDAEFPHVAAACMDTAELSLDEARPYLSAQALRTLAPGR